MHELRAICQKTPQAFYSPEPELKKKSSRSVFRLISPAKDLVSLKHTVLRCPQILNLRTSLDGVSLVDLRLCDDTSNVTCEESPGNFDQCRESIEAVGDRTLHHSAGHTIDPRVNVFCPNGVSSRAPSLPPGGPLLDSTPLEESLAKSSNPQ